MNLGGNRIGGAGYLVLAVWAKSDLDMASLSRSLGISPPTLSTYINTPAIHASKVFVERLCKQLNIKLADSSKIILDIHERAGSLPEYRPEVKKAAIAIEAIKVLKEYDKHD